MIENGMLAGAQAQYEAERFGEELPDVIRQAFAPLWMPRGPYPTAKFPEGLEPAAVFVERGAE